MFKLFPWVDLDPFYAKVKFGHIGFCTGKSENYLFFYQGHSLTLVKSHSDFAVKTCFSQKQLGDLEPKFILKLEGEEE